MKRLISTILLIISVYSAYSQGLVSENKELSRATFVSYRNDVAKTTRDKKYSENYVDLSGDWQCQYLTGENSKVFALPAANELNGFGRAIYSEQAYPFLKAKPEGAFVTPDNSQEVVYTRNFAVPFDFTDRLLYIHIGAANSSVKLFVNDEYVGYSTDSRNPAEFDISKFVGRGYNSIELRVANVCDGSFLEDQTGWRFSGLNREIFLFAQPKIRVRDYTVRTTLDPTYTNGLLEAALILKSELLNTHSVTVFYDLYDPQGNLVNQASKEITTRMRGEDTVRFTATIQDVKQWNNETPNLYTILYRVKREGRFTEYVSVKAGFRTVEIKDNKLQINGKAIKIRGVNYGEFSSTTGNVLSSTEMRNAIQEMKYAGFNAIRTDGYPLPDEFYNLCDEMGMYVCDVANINAQGVGLSIYKGKTLANDPSWLEHFLYRVNNNYERNKSHTSVIMWALGDNAGNGYNMYEAYMMLKSKDTTRPVVYNGGGMEFNTDIFCSDYPVLQQPVEEQNSQRNLRPVRPSVIPTIFSRCKFDPTIWTSDRFQGGFIDRWTSPSITISGKFAEISNEYKITEKGNGLINLSSAQDNLSEISTLFKGVDVRIIDVKKGILEFENNLDFANLNELKITYQIIKGGFVKKEYPLEVNVQPGEKTQITLPKKVTDILIGKDEAIILVGNLAKFSFKN